MPPVPVLVSWSSGKDSAWALHALRRRPDAWEVRGVFTTITTAFDRVSIQATPRWALEAQAEKLGLPLYEIPIPWPCPNAEYEAAMRGFLARVRALPERLGASRLAFGDLFLEDIRRYREESLRGTGFAPLFPIWGRNTAELAGEMLDSGLKAVVTAVDPAKLPARFVGRPFDRAFIADLPPGTDPLGENGEFHTCVLDGPMFSAPIRARAGRVVEREPAAREARLEYEGMGDGATFWTPPMTEETEITGPMASRLFVSSSTEDADLFLIVRVFDPEGGELTFMGSTDPHTPIANGWLRASHRALDPEKSAPYRPWHPHDKAEPLTPGEVYECDVEIVTSCIVVPVGWRVALTVRGKDYEYAGEVSEFAKQFHYSTKGTGGMTHNDPDDRPPAIFDNRVTLHAGGGRDPYLLLPIIPPKDGE